MKSPVPSFPFATTAEMTDAVVGGNVQPSPSAWYAVAGLLVPGSASSRFRRLDRTVYSPLCLALAVGAATSLAA